MNVNILLLGLLKGVEMETTFSLFKIVLSKSNLPLFSTLLFQDGGNIVEDEFPESSFEAEAVSIEQIAVLVFLEK